MSEADDLDRAADLTQELADCAVEAVRRAAQPEQVRVDGKWPQKECEDCGDTIPVKRLNLGKIRCIYCQERLEVRRAGR